MSSEVLIDNSPQSEGCVVLLTSEASEMNINSSCILNVYQDSSYLEELHSSPYHKARESGSKWLGRMREMLSP